MKLILENEARMASSVYLLNRLIGLTLIDYKSERVAGKVIYSMSESTEFFRPLHHGFWVDYI